MRSYIPPNPDLWTGRLSGKGLYLHENIRYLHLDTPKKADTDIGPAVALLGYACEEGIRRNQGRPGAAKGPDAIRHQLGRMPMHLDERILLFDAGSVNCTDGDLEGTQADLTLAVSGLLDRHYFPLVVGGGHDMSYGHFNGLLEGNQNKTIGIINFDAHFDLRSNEKTNNSGTPFYQIASDCHAKNLDFRYLCLGIRRDANDRELFQTAEQLGVDFISAKQFTLQRLVQIEREVLQFISEVDAIYVTIDLDGFSSAYAPGVSAASPMGFSPDIVLEILKVILDSTKTVGVDIAEMNPDYDPDGQTAKLGASLIHFILDQLPLF